MSLRKTTRNQEIAEAVAAGEPLKLVADRFGVSVSRVSKISQVTTTAKITTIADVKPTLIEMQRAIITMQALLNSLLQNGEFSISANVRRNGVTHTRRMRQKKTQKRG